MPTARLAIMADDTNYGSLGALAPNWSDGERNIDTDEIYERFFEWVADIKGVEPWPHQEEAIMDLLAGDPTCWAALFPVQPGESTDSTP